MQNNYLRFKQFASKEQATDLQQFLIANGIDAQLADNIPPVDVTFSGSTIHNEYEVQILGAHFTKATQLLEVHAAQDLEAIDKDYYLFSFTDEELYDILLKADEWSAFDYTLAQKLLEERGKPIDATKLKELKQQRLQDLAKPETDQKAWIIAGYFFALMGGAVGLIVGYYLWKAKKTLPNGQEVYTYTRNNRLHGQYIFFIGLLVTPAMLLYKFRFAF